MQNIDIIVLPLIGQHVWNKNINILSRIAQEPYQDAQDVDLTHKERI